MNKTIAILLIVLMGSLCATVFSVQNVSIDYRPVENISSALTCGYVGNTAEVILLELDYINGTNIVSFSENLQANTTHTLGYYNFSGFTENNSVYLNCTVDTVQSFSDTYKVIPRKYFFGAVNDDSLFLGIPFTMLMLALVFAYKFTNAGSQLWADVWLFLIILIIIGTVFILTSFTDSEGALSLGVLLLTFFTIGISLLTLFFLTLILKLWNMVIQFLREAIDGK